MGKSLVCAKSTGWPSTKPKVRDWGQGQGAGVMEWFGDRNRALRRRLFQAEQQLEVEREFVRVLGEQLRNRDDQVFLLRERVRELERAKSGEEGEYGNGA